MAASGSRRPRPGWLLAGVWASLACASVGLAQGAGPAVTDLPSRLPVAPGYPRPASVVAPLRLASRQPAPWSRVRAAGRTSADLASASGPSRAGSRLGAPRWPRSAYATAVVAVGGGLLAQWCRARADAAYDRYLHAAGLRRQERAFSRAERYDRLAGTGLVAMEAGLVATACLVFF